MRLPRASALLLALGALAAPVRAAGACEGSIPLRERHPALQARLERALRAANLGEVLDRRQLTVALADLTHPDAIAYAVSVPRGSAVQELMITPLTETSWP